MIRLFISAVVSIAVAGCASSPPQATASNSATAISVTAVVANVEADDGSIIDVIDVPPVAQTAMVEPKRDNLVCRREKVTGSNRSEKVCRTTQEIESTRQATQRAIRSANSRTGSAGSAQ